MLTPSRGYPMGIEFELAVLQPDTLELAQAHFFALALMRGGACRRSAFQSAKT
jgi:hypothetical protein